MKLFIKFAAAPEMVISTLKKISDVSRSVFSRGSAIEIHSLYCWFLDNVYHYEKTWHGHTAVQGQTVVHAGHASVQP